MRSARSTLTSASNCWLVSRRSGRNNDRRSPACTTPRQPWRGAWRRWTRPRRCGSVCSTRRGSQRATPCGPPTRSWVDTGLPGIRARVLAVDQARSLVTLVIRAEPGAVYPSHKHHGPEECFVISGSVVIDGRVLRAGDFHHADEDSDHGEITTTEGADVLLVGAVEDYLPHQKFTTKLLSKTAPVTADRLGQRERAVAARR